MTDMFIMSYVRWEAMSLLGLKCWKRLLFPNFVAPVFLAYEITVWLMPLILILVQISMWTQTLNFKLNINPYLIQF